MDYEELRIAAFRARIFGKIEECLKEDGHCKSYEGRLTVSKQYPDYFGHVRCETSVIYSIQLDLYVFGPNRHYRWESTSLADAIDKAESDVSGWMLDEELERAAEEREGGEG